jgi:hypothetical protein
MFVVKFVKLLKRKWKKKSWFLEHDSMFLLFKTFLVLKLEKHGDTVFQRRIGFATTTSQLHWIQDYFFFSQFLQWQVNQNLLYECFLGILHMVIHGPFQKSLFVSCCLSRSCFPFYVGDLCEWSSLVVWSNVEPKCVNTHTHTHIYIW